MIVARGGEEKQHHDLSTLHTGPRELRTDRQHLNRILRLTKLRSTHQAWVK